MTNSNVFFAILIPIFAFMLCSCAPENNYCKNADNHNNAVIFLELVKYDLCGNLYRFKHGREIRIKIPSEHQLQKSVFYKSYFSASINESFAEWNDVMSEYDITLIPTYDDSNFTLSIQMLPYNDNKLTLGRTKFNVIKSVEDINNIFSYSDLRISTDFYINSIDITISPDINPLWSNRIEMDDILFKRTVMHELGHFLGIYGHSEYDDDIMSIISDRFKPVISVRDIKTIDYIYKRPIDLPIIN